MRVRPRRWRSTAFLAVAMAMMVLPTGSRPVLAAEYTLDTVVTYAVRPDDAEIAVAIDLEFTNTTPDPAGRFSVFDELRLALHDGAQGVVARDEDGELDVDIEEGEGITIVTIDLRDPIRYEESVTLEVEYRIVDGEDPEVRIGPQLVVFPAWGFGTESDVSIAIPPGFEVRVDGDGLAEGEDGLLTSGPITDPTAWLARVSALGPGEYVVLTATIPLDGGTADVMVRAFADDPEWGELTRDVVTEALPLLEREVGLPYPLLGQLVVTQSALIDSSGFGESVARRGEVVVAYDQPPFTLLHQLGHLWLDEPLVDSRWIAEGLASDHAARVADELDIEQPFDPAAESERLAADARPLDEWGAVSDPAFEAYAHAHAWALVADIRAEVGDDALRTVLARTASSIGPYDGIAMNGLTPTTAQPRSPLTSRAFLDQLEAVSGVELADRFADSVFTEEEAALLADRAAARTAFDELVEAADGWGAPDPVRAAMTAWQFADAAALIDESAAWLDERDDLLSDMERVGLSRPERLPQAFRAYGGGPEAVDELAAERTVVDTYAAAAERINAPRSLLARLGLVGATDPATHLDRANGLFADGDLRGAIDSIDQAERMLDSAETSGIVRLLSLAVLVIGAAVVAVALFRRRTSYTAAP